MKKSILYQYLGTNGTILSPVFLEGAYCVKKIQLLAEKDRLLTNGTEYKISVIVPEGEVENWKEVPDGGQL